MSDSSRHSLYAIAEAAYGVTPAVTPAFNTVRHTGATLGITKGTFVSEELRSDRQISDMRHGTKQTGGEIQFELSYGSFDNFLEAVLCGTWTANVLKAGTTRRSFSVLRDFADITTDRFELYTGVELNNLSLTVPVEGMVTGSFAAIGKGMSIADAAPAGATFTQPTTTSPLDGFNGALKEGGVTIATVTEIQFTLENGIAPRFTLGSDEVQLRASIGRSNLSGNLTVHAEDASMLKKFLNETESTLELNLVDGAGNAYKFEFPRIKYNGGQRDTSGQGPITSSLPFQALYDSTSTSQIVVTRTPHA